MIISKEMKNVLKNAQLKSKLLINKKLNERI